MSEGPLGFGEDADDDRGAAREPGRRPARVPSRGLPSPGGAGPLGLRRPGPGGWVLGAAVVVILGLILLNTLRSDGPGSRGLAVGAPAPPFAAPLAGSKLAASGDVNYATRPDAGDAGDVPACSIDEPGVLTSCALWRTRPAVIAFFATRGKQCVSALDELDDVARRHPDVDVAAVAIRGDLGTVRDLQRTRGWRFPVAYDRDGVTANLYAVAVCPQLAFVAPGGRVQSTSVGGLDGRALEARFAALER